MSVLLREVPLRLVEPLGTSAPPPTEVLAMQMRINSIPFLLAPLALAAAALPAGAKVVGNVTRVSVDSNGVEANDTSITNTYSPLSISPDGRFVAFNSRASNLVGLDTNGVPDVFVRDLYLGTTERVSVSTTGQEGLGDAYARGSYGTSLSSDGRYVAFDSFSPNLVSADTGGWQDVFVHDRVTGTTERVSLSTSSQSPNGPSNQPSISADGRYVVFCSSATNLVSGDTNGKADVFVRDLLAHTTKRVSVSSSGQQGNGYSQIGTGNQMISSNGRYVLFHSAATNLVAGDTNAQYDVFVRDMSLLTTQRVSLTSTGAQANGYSQNPCMSADGRYVAFFSSAANLAPPGAPAGVPQLYVRDRQLATTVCASVSPLGAGMNNMALPRLSISGDGRYLGFQSQATNLVAGTGTGWNLFVRDVVFGTTSCPAAGGGIGEVAIDATGLTIVLDSSNPNLVPGDTNGVRDVFVVQ